MSKQDENIFGSAVWNIFNGILSDGIDNDSIASFEEARDYRFITDMSHLVCK